MQPTLESRPDLELNSAVRAFGPTADLTYARLDEQSLDRVVQAAAAGDLRAIVVDLGQAAYISTDAIGDLLALKRRLSRGYCVLVVLAENPTLREFFAGAELNRRFVIAGSRAELTDRLQFI